MSRLSSHARQVGAAFGIMLLSACSSPENRPQEINAYHVDFENGSAVVDATGQQTLAAVSEAARQNHVASVTIVGRSGATGSGATSAQLAKRRAMAVHDALLATGDVTAEQIQTIWVSEKPAVTGMQIGGPTPGSRTVDLYVQ